MLIEPGLSSKTPLIPIKLPFLFLELRSFKSAPYIESFGFPFVDKQLCHVCYLWQGILCQIPEAAQKAGNPRIVTSCFGTNRRTWSVALGKMIAALGTRMLCFILLKKKKISTSLMGFLCHKKVTGLYRTVITYIPCCMFTGECSIWFYRKRIWILWQL